MIIAIPKLSKEMLKYVSDKQPYSVQSIRYMAVVLIGIDQTYAASVETPLSISGSSSSSLVSNVLLNRHLLPAR